MKTFHQSLVDQIALDDLPQLKNHCYVFPTKRGGVFFKQSLLRTFKGNNFFLPAILSIEEFVEKLTKSHITDELTLLFELFKVYQQKDKNLDFDRFYAWGKIILKDYDEIDRYQADANSIYLGLQELKEIENVFGFNDELREIVSHFRSVTDKQEKTKLLTDFLRIWEAVGKVYIEFDKAITAKGLEYGGRLYRKLAEEVQKKDFDHPFSFYHICGFNALSSSEESIFGQLVSQGRGQLYWDVDDYYMTDTMEEAGDFLRQYKGKWPDSVWLSTNSLATQKHINISAVPQNVGQAHLAAQYLKNGLANGWRPEETALVLADEKLLLPVLYAIPFDEHKVNVTMGYPVKFTVAFDFVERYLELFRKSGVKENEVSVYVFDLKPLLSNAYCSVLEPNVYESVVNWCLREKKTKVRLTEIIDQVKSPELKSLFKSAADWQSIFEHINAYLTQVFYHFKKQEEHTIDREFIYFFLKEFNQIGQYLEERTEAISLKLVKKLVKEHFKVAKIPFEGEPVEGFQIMGFLETRTLDFKNLIVLSANEGKLPAQRSSNSYIPYALRKAFGLPTFEEQDAIYAYHFKRLLQRAENINFVYDSEVSKDSTGERSRFILQQLRRYKTYDNIKVTEQQFTGKINPPDLTEKPIIIEKTNEVLENMKRYFKGSEEGKFLSPTSLTTYVGCSLRFYFQYVLRIRENDEIEEDIDARIFGIVVHRVLELLYQPWLGKTIDSEEIKTLEKLVSLKVGEVLTEEKIIQEHQGLEGKDLLTRKIMERLVLKILKLDQAEAPITIKGLERHDLRYSITLATDQTVLLGGTVDRMDERDGVMRIIDYKTGKVTLSSPTNLKKPIPEYIAQYFTNDDLKSGFQGYFYGLLARPEISQDFQVGVLGMKALNNGVQWLRNGDVISNEIMNEFEDQLQQMVKEIYDPTVPFVQTEDVKRCEYCAYKKICGR
ncbi:MAG: CRISPR/Cas system-associated exonuclease Cas4 (RecB family) [Roseivirga sp.]|jgi:CRISPR/Cas system-associated exonuclease Cas4 (RecB family)